MEWFYIDENGKPEIAAEVLAHPVFLRLYNLHGKDGLLVVWYMSSPIKNPYWNMFEADRRNKLASEFVPFESEEDLSWPEIIENSIQLLSDMFASISPAYVTVFKARFAAERALTFLQTVDYSKETKTGHMKYKPSDVSKSIRELTVDIENMNKMLQVMKEELKPTAIGRKGRSVSLFENPTNLTRRALE